MIYPVPAQGCGDIISAIRPSINDRMHELIQYWITLGGIQKCSFLSGSILMWYVATTSLITSPGIGWRQDRTSARTNFCPSLYWMGKSHPCTCRSMCWRHTRTWAKFFSWLATRDLWSIWMVNWWLYIYVWNCLAPNLHARNLHTIFTYICSLHVVPYLQKPLVVHPGVGLH